MHHVTRLHQVSDVSILQIQLWEICTITYTNAANKIKKNSCKFHVT